MCRHGRWRPTVEINYAEIDIPAATIPVISALLEERIEAPTPPNRNVTTPMIGEGILTSENMRKSRREKGNGNGIKRFKNEKSDFWNAVLASTTRRKGVGSSPLASVQEEAEAEGASSGSANGQEGQDVAMTDSDGDVVMSSPEQAPTEPATVNPQHLVLSSPALSSTTLPGRVMAFPVVTLKEIIRKKSMKRKLRRVDSERAHELVEDESNWGGFQESRVDLLDDPQYDMPPLERVQSRQEFMWQAQMAELR